MTFFFKVLNIQPSGNELVLIWRASFTKVGKWSMVAWRSCRLDKPYIYFSLFFFYHILVELKFFYPDFSSEKFSYPDLTLLGFFPQWHINISNKIKCRNINLQSTREKMPDDRKGWYFIGVKWNHVELFPTLALLYVHFRDDTIFPSSSVN